MIAYNKTDLENTLLVEEALNLYDGGFINKEQYRMIESELPPLKKQPRLLLRAGLLLVGLILCASIGGVVSLFAFSLHDAGIIAFVIAAITLVGLEWMVRSKKYFGYGLDDAFLWSFQLATGAGVLIVLEALDYSEQWTIWFWGIGVLVVTSLCALRYLNVVSLVAACVFATFTAVYWLVEEKVSLASFAMMAFAALLGLGFYTLRKRTKADVYSALWTWGWYYSLLLFYLSGNMVIVLNFSLYFYMAEASDMVVSLHYIDYFYWFMTFAVPLSYIALGVKQRDKGSLWLGLFTLAFSLYNLVQLTAFLSGAWWLTLGGLLLFGLTFILVKRLKNKQTGLTFEADRLADDTDFIHVEALIVAAQLGLKPGASQEAPMKMGGGDFSGGGAGGSF
ncbi:hypothetical protein [Flavobacterium sp. JP2137]|uniref:hypothetical protein n=1 Tax=Flavobacterium sp. JP2137 TaxID=3414510 RepID=UPI003D2FD107